MQDAFSRIAALAPTLSEAPLRLLIHIQNKAPNGTILASQRELAKAVPLSRSNIQLAIEELERRGLLVCSRGATATRAKEYRLLLMETAVLPERGPIAGPQEASKQGQGGPVSGPQVDLFQGHDGPTSGPHPRARIAPGSESDSDWEGRIRATSDLFERIAKAKPESYDSDEIRTVREALCGYWRRMKEEPDAHPPPDKLCAEMLAIASRRRILQLIDELWRNRQKPDRSYRWFVTVALNRIHHLEPAHIGKGFAQLRAIEKHVPDPVQRALLPDDDKERMLALDAMVKRAAAGKALR